VKVFCWALSPTTESYLKEGIRQYATRLPHYIAFEYQEIVVRKKTADMREAEKNEIMKLLKPGDFLVLLDENGNEMNSTSFANWLQGRFNDTSGNIIFLTGGAYGFHQELVNRANYKLSLSQLTFTHQMVRLFFLEQLYRAMTIMRNEKYHHDG
jgi:23S rRNA (pseudouridine1915-N3)-methyltransferase